MGTPEKWERLFSTDCKLSGIFTPEGTYDCTTPGNGEKAGRQQAQKVMIINTALGL